MNQLSMNLNRKVNFHQISGIVYLPSKANQKTLYIPEIKTNDYTQQFNTVYNIQLDMSGWDKATIQVVSPVGGSIAVLATNDNGADIQGRVHVTRCKRNAVRSVVA